MTQQDNKLKSKKLSFEHITDLDMCRYVHTNIISIKQTNYQQKTKMCEHVAI